jgi:DNA-binding transcriptional LysR family regulator
MPELHVAEGEKAGRLARIFPDWSLPSPPIHLVYATRQLPERVRLLIDFLCEALRTR